MVVGVVWCGVVWCGVVWCGVCGVGVCVGQGRGERGEGREREKGRGGGGGSDGAVNERPVDNPSRNASNYGGHVPVDLPGPVPMRGTPQGLPRTPTVRN